MLPLTPGESGYLPFPIVSLFFVLFFRFNNPGLHLHTIWPLPDLFNRSIDCRDFSHTSMNHNMVDRFVEKVCSPLLVVIVGLVFFRYSDS